MKLIVCILVALIIFPKSIIAQETNDILKRLDSDISILNNLMSISNQAQSGEEVLEILKVEIPKVINHLESSITLYSKKESETSDQELKKIISKINSSITNLSSTLNDAEQSIYNQDSVTFEQSLTNYDVYIANLNSAVKELETYSGIVDYVPLLAWSFWISLTISAVLFIISRGNPILPAEKLRNQFEFALFKSSLWPLGGSAVSYFWGLLTPAGETYYVFWWPIIIGYFQFAKGLFNYIKYARPAINLAKVEQQKKLESLLITDEFQHSNMKEQLAEIEKLKPLHKITV